ncbi:MAG: S-layer homology domain-containing protein, partial [Oscillospiraceae bacterium]|nr:S-layer homology domain-containing protein [Oscillospiraceae bacterium]
NDWFSANVTFVFAHELFTGTTATTFNPSAPMTRAMLVTVLHRLAGNPESTGASIFGDVDSDMWYADAVNWAAEIGIVGGIGGNLFAPEVDITREQMAVIFTNFARVMDIALPKKRNGGFLDASEIGDWAKDAVEAMFAAGIINGKPGELFDPKATATRAEVAAMLHAFLQALAGE